MKHKSADIESKSSNVIPSSQDLSMTRSKPDIYDGTKGWRKKVRSHGGDYTVITKGKTNN